MHRKRILLQNNYSFVCKKMDGQPICFILSILLMDKGMLISHCCFVGLMPEQNSRVGFFLRKQQTTAGSIAIYSIRKRNFLQNELCKPSSLCSYHCNYFLKPSIFNEAHHRNVSVFFFKFSPSLISTPLLLSHFFLIFNDFPLCLEKSCTFKIVSSD